MPTMGPVTTVVSGAVPKGLSQNLSECKGLNAMNFNFSLIRFAIALSLATYHDMLHEPERDQIAADVIAWLNART
jgi:hypothetical protein